jgi:hypothetical protein
MAAAVEVLPNQLEKHPLGRLPAEPQIASAQ